MENNVFFGENGLTSTSANHIANKAKEYYNNILESLKSMNLIKTEISIIGSEEKIVSDTGTREAFDHIYDSLKEVSECNSLIAWLREGIKEKERLAKEAKYYENPELIKLQIQRPIKERSMSTEDAIAKLSVNDRARYYELEAIAAAIGKFVHPAGALSNARTAYNRIIQKPIKVDKSGRDTLIEYYTPIVTEEELEKVFFDLQGKHREVEAELNGLKHTIDQMVNKDEMDKVREYDVKFTEWSNKIDTLNNKQSEERLQKSQEIENLKIIIPNRLKTIYEKINKL